MSVGPHSEGGRRGGPPPFERVVALHGPDLLRFCAARVGPESGLFGLG